MEKSLTLQEVHDKLEKIEEELKKADNRIRYINIHVNPVKTSKKREKKQKQTIWIKISKEKSDD